MHPNVPRPAPRPSGLAPFLACLVAGFAGAFGSASAADLLLKAGHVHTVSQGTHSPGQVLIRGDKIVAVGEQVSSGDAQVLDLGSQHLYPGLISLNCVLGLTEIEAIRATEDYAEVGEFNPDVESWMAVNPDSELIPVARANGIACFEPVPTAGVVAGYSGLVAADGWTTEKMAIKQRLALHVFWPKLDLEMPDSSRPDTKAKPLAEQAKARATKLRALDDFFQDARAYAKAKDAGSNTPANRVPAWEAMLPVIRREVPLVIHADQARQIRAAAAWARTNQFRWMLAGGRDSWTVADLLAKEEVPVLYSHVFSQPWRGTDSYDVHFRAPEVLRAAGVRVIFSMGVESFDAPLVKNLPYVAAQAVAFGFPAEEALKAMTLHPAQSTGLGERLGSISPGKDATLFASSGDILDIRSQVTRSWIAGKEVSLQTRHTRLYEKYQARPK